MTHSLRTHFLLLVLLMACTPVLNDPSEHVPQNLDSPKSAPSPSVILQTADNNTSPVVPRPPAQTTPPFWEQSQDGYSIQLLADREALNEVKTLVTDLTDQTGNNNQILTRMYQVYPPSMTDIELDSRDNIYALDKDSQSVLKITPQGQVTSVFKLLPEQSSSIGLQELGHIAVSSDGQSVFIKDAKEPCLYRFQDALEKMICDPELEQFETFFMEQDELKISILKAYSRSRFRGTVPYRHFYVLEQNKLRKTFGFHMPIKNSKGEFFKSNISVTKYIDDPLEVRMCDIGLSYRDGPGDGHSCSNWARYCPVRGHVDGPAEVAEFDHPEALAITPDDTLYVSDTGNKKLRTIDSDMTVKTVPLNFAYPLGDMAIDSNGDLIAVYGLQLIKIKLPRTTLSD